MRLKDKKLVRIQKGKNIVDINPGNGLICGLYTDFGEYNLADKAGMGGIRYTLKGDDIRTDVNYRAYCDKLAVYDSVDVNEDVVTCRNEEYGICTTYTLKPDSLVISSCAADPEISQFGIDLNLNFLSKKNGTYIGQLLPSSPYTSYAGDRMYCIMPVIGLGFCAIVAKTPCKAWKIDYSEYSFGHFIQGFQMMSAMDELFSQEENRSLSLEITYARTIEECYEKIQTMFCCPMLLPEVSGSFDEKLTIKVLGEADKVRVVLEDKEEILPVTDHSVTVRSMGYGRHTVIPYANNEPGLDTVIWFGEDIRTLFEKSCDTIEEPYHCDRNLCEGMTWCWAMLSYMNLYHSDKYMPQVEKAVQTIMGEGEQLVQHNTIVPYALGNFPAYHIHESRRVQEQFFGISILTEMYRHTMDTKYLDFAVKAAETMIETYQKENGAIVPHTDYTTVCAPIIPIIDLAVLLQDTDTEKAEYFAESARKIADYLVKRGLSFPTEGIKSEVNDEEMEDGSMSCTALSVLYYCRYIERRQDYIDFAEKVLALHDYWISYTPDVRLYRSTMRWWETIWEGDGSGPAVCAGHAWTIWRAEADFHMGVLTGNKEYFVKSWNGFMTNFSKITAEGRSYSCYQPDYFTGGGELEIKQGLMQLSGEDMEKKYEITHNYPRHYDNSLSRYVWARACAAWLKTEADPFFLKGDGM